MSIIINGKKIAGTYKVQDIGVATTSSAGLVKPDGDTITIDSDGTIHGSKATSLEWGNITGDISNQTDLQDFISSAGLSAEYNEDSGELVFTSSQEGTK
jgi:hypothetical protein